MGRNEGLAGRAGNGTQHAWRVGRLLGRNRDLSGRTLREPPLQSLEREVAANKEFSRIISIGVVTLALWQSLDAVGKQDVLGPSAGSRKRLGAAQGRMLRRFLEYSISGHQELAQIAIRAAPCVGRNEGRQWIVDVDHLRHGIMVVGGIAKRLAGGAQPPEQII